jgi:hypothetical protein
MTSNGIITIAIYTFVRYVILVIMIFLALFQVERGNQLHYATNIIKTR